MKKRILSMFLAVAMMFSIVGVLPVISAEESFNDNDILFPTSAKAKKRWAERGVELPITVTFSDNDANISYAIIDFLEFTKEDGTDIEFGYTQMFDYEHNCIVVILEDYDNVVDDETAAKLVETGMVAKDIIGLRLTGTQIKDFSFLNGLTNLTQLSLTNNQISDISFLSDLTNLEELHLYNNQISDVSPLKGLTNLKKLNLSRNQISDISPLKGLTNLEQFSIDENPISVSVSVTIFDVLNILKSLAGMENELDKNIVSLSMTLLTEESRAAGKPTIFDALEILKKLAGM